MKKKPARVPMTLGQFSAWIRGTLARRIVEPYEIIACSCGDLNCHGWRLVPPR